MLDGFQQILKHAGNCLPKSRSPTCRGVENVGRRVLRRVDEGCLVAVVVRRDIPSSIREMNFSPISSDHLPVTDLRKTRFLDASHPFEPPTDGTSPFYLFANCLESLSCYQTTLYRLI